MRERGELGDVHCKQTRRSGWSQTEREYREREGEGRVKREREGHYKSWREKA